MKKIYAIQLIPKSIGRFALGALLLACPVSLLAQETNTDDEEVYELSPFEVSTSENIGYLANDTLAGTRINSQLQDIANSVQVVTAEFIEDVGATDINELLIYTTSTEAAGVNGNASFGELNSGTERGERARREPQLNTRVRGLAVADLARDYFISDVAFDSYNSSEITINRGPNASLFGLGSPGGIINQAIDRAETNRTFGEVNFKIDEFDAWRASLNYNQVVIEDELAVRVAYLDSNKRYEQQNAKYDEERYFAAATWRPMKNMAIRANYEKGEGFGNRPKLRPPTDRITPWIENGKPGYNPVTNEFVINGEVVTDPAYIAQLNSASPVFATIGHNGNPMMIYDDPNSPIPGNNGYPVLQVGLNRNAAGRTDDSAFPRSLGNIRSRMFASPRQLFARNPDYIVGARPDIPAHHRSFYSDVQITDLDIINIRKNNLTGPGADYHKQDFEIWSIRAEKTFLDNDLGFEVAYQKQYWDADLAEAQTASSASNISVDINTHLLDGSPNPNFGRPFIGGRGYAQYRIRKREAAQAIGFYKYDFADKHDGWLSKLGRHALTAVYQSQENEETAPNRQNARATPAWYSSIALGGPGTEQAEEWTASPRWRGNGRVGLVQYLGPSMVDVDSIENAGIQGVTARQVIQGTDNALRWNPYNGQFEQGSVDFYTAQENPLEVWTWGNPLNADEIESISSVLQSHFLDGHVVTTVSWRKDSVKTYNAAAESDPATQLTVPGPIEYGEPDYDDSTTQTTWGAVVHVPDRWLPDGIGLSAHYVDSSNFAAGTAGVDIYNRPAPLQTGVTEEYGFSISAFDGKLYARANFFESSQQWVKITGTLPNFFNDLKRVLENNEQSALEAAGFNPFNDTVIDSRMLEASNFRPDDASLPWHETIWTADNIAGTSTNYYQDVDTEGSEFEITYAPTPNWRLAFNASRTEVVVSNVMRIAAPAMIDIANRVMLDPVFGNFFINPDPVLNPDTGEYDNDDLLRSRADNLINAVAQKRAPEGGPLQEIREWRWNLITNYSFRGSRWDDTFLSGFAVGAAVRWQDKVAIGSDLKDVDVGVAVPDYDNLYYGPSETNVDAWITYNTDIMYDMKLQIQLRVRNLNAGSGEFIPIKANPDGEVALWRIGAPRYFELSARLRF
ncbi:MAG: TonB-dependent receptor plug domain-containing protein [Puniceicoccaceae bacterium]